ncbi:MAG TPA: amidohydrolase family protein [Bacillota bacterium]|nr:amidohydrolase family protein [Bacillota bacterium]
MSNDIFSDYIRKQRERPAAPRETEVLLQEISGKLDLLAASGPDCQVDLAIVNGSVVLPGNGIFKTNVYIKDGKVYSLGDLPGVRAARTVDAAGRFVAPGIIDPHVHLGLFAPMREELDTETKSALIGGVTTAGCYFGGVESHFSTFPAIAEEINRRSFIDIIPHLVIGTDEQRREIGDYIRHFGVTSFKVYMNGIPGMIGDVDDGFIMDVLGELNKSDKKCILCTHAENRDLIRRANRIIKEEKGDGATVRDWTDTHPDMAEEEAVIRLSFLAEKSGTPVYFVHISSRSAINKLKSIKQRSKYIHIETTSPYLSITRDAPMNNRIKMEPPFRDPEDVEALWNAVQSGVVDTIGTDNVTMTLAEKNIGGSIWNAMPGYPAVGTHLPVVLHEGVVKRGVPLDLVIGLMTKNPAEIFGVYPRKGTLLPGSDADVVIIDMNLEKEVRAEECGSRSDFSLYEGKRLTGWPVLTVKGGEIVAENGRCVAAGPGGRCLYRGQTE